MTNDERDELLIRMDERLRVIDAKLAADFRILHGNGHPGLISRVQALEDQHQSESKHIGAIAGVGGFIVSIAVAAYSAFKH